MHGTANWRVAFALYNRKGTRYLTRKGIRYLMQLSTFFDRLWADYVCMAPCAATLKAVFEQCGETVVNDHVAFRTFDLDPIRITALEPHILALGYRRFAPYTFPGKYLTAWGYVHADPLQPRIFLSALDVSKLSAVVQAIVRELCAQIDPAQVKDPSVFWVGRLWKPVTHAQYRALLTESEYAAWLAAIGLRPNHFTISINHLKKYPSVEAVLQVVEAQGMPINTEGGRVKGTPAVLLEQASTLADEQPVAFADGTFTVPTCYYEFALRHRDARGKLFDGFVPASADKIFASTNVKT